jgi:AraC family transcriptional regulator
MNSLKKPESTDIGGLFKGSELRRRSTTELGWNGVAVERRAAAPSEKPEVVVDQHFLVLWETVAEGEMASRNGQYQPYKKYPNTISTLVPGLFPAVRNLSPHIAVVCAISPTYLKGIESQLDQRPLGSLHELRGQNDIALRDLVRLLVTEADEGGPSGRLYAESLFTALATRVLYLGRSIKEPEPGKVSALPRHLLRKVVSRMEASLHADLALKTLAAETGYSQSQFLRMFRTATGQTPHRYLLDMRLDRVKELLARRTMSLIDIAAHCGFSSQSHLSTAFRSRFGLAPSRYARDL